MKKLVNHWLVQCLMSKFSLREKISALEEQVDNLLEIQTALTKELQAQDAHNAELTRKVIKLVAQFDDLWEQVLSAQETTHD